MSVWLFIAATAAAEMLHPVKAEPKGSPADWVRATDLPKIDEQVGVTTFDLTIDETGHASNCVIVVTSGSNQLDAAVCAAVMKRARFRPAKDGEGTPIPSVYRDRVVWRPYGSGYNRWTKKPDIVVSTPRASTDVKRVAEVIVMIDNTGEVNKCFVADSIRDAALDELACAAARNPKISTPVTDSEGALHQGIRSFYVGFQPAQTTTIEIR
ncbi:MAG TPA: energy transducer TonB [Novosphingobium sp.]|nr:energy transducer TonB [Novosphingobium sp.]